MRREAAYYNRLVPVSRRQLLASAMALPLLAEAPAQPLKIVVAGGHPGDPACGCAGTVRLSGIAYDPRGDRLFVTGKRWAKLFEIRLLKKVDAP
jgi:hypothetical protein